MNITDLRNELFETMQLLKQGKLDVSQAKAISDLGQVIVNTAKAETEFIKNQGGCGSGFIPVMIDTPSQIQRPKAQYANKGYQQLLDEYAPENA